jgi:putative aldouronate transport system permease protein
MITLRENLKKWKTRAIVLSVIVLLITMFLGYASNVKIDEGTANMYQTLNVLFICFIVVSILSLLPVSYLVYKDYQSDKQFHLTVKKSRLNKKIAVFDVINYSFMIIFMICCIYPIFFVFIGSFNQGADYTKGGVYLLPRLFTFENYRVVLQNPGLWRGYGITISRTILGTVLALVYTSIVAYAMSRSNLKYKKVIYWINIFTMFFGGGLIPYFLIIQSVGLYDSFLVYIIPALFSVYNMIIMSSFFNTISNEIHESALVDGANEFRIYWQIYMPLSKPILATVGLWIAVGHWNAYFDTMIFTNNKNLQSLQYFLLKAIQTSTLTEGMPPEMMLRLSPKTLALAAIILTTIPVLFFFPFVRKNFQSGIMIGSLKG